MKKTFNDILSEVPKPKKITNSEIKMPPYFDLMWDIKYQYQIYQNYMGCLNNKKVLAALREHGYNVEHLLTNDCASMNIHKEKEDAAIANGWRREFIDGNGVDRELWVSPDSLCYDDLPEEAYFSATEK